VDIDLHTHTYPASSCSHISYRDYIAACKQRGLSAVALTNHGDVSDNRKLEQPLADEGVTLIHGVEISTPLGDFVIFSPDLDWLAHFTDVQDVPQPASIPEHAAVVWVHPAAGGGRSGSAYQPAMDRLVAPLVHGVEIYNGNWLDEKYVHQAEAIARQLGVAMTGGSDAHQAARLMACFTEVATDVTDTADVVRSLRARTTVPHRHEPPPRRRFGLFR
jgi:predicted metal-dependent phosphoesterase TrpH